MKAGVGTRWAVHSIPRKEQQDRSDDKKSQRDFNQCELVNGEVRANVEMQRPAHPECASGHVEQRRKSLIPVLQCRTKLCALRSLNFWSLFFA